MRTTRVARLFSRVAPLAVLLLVAAACGSPIGAGVATPPPYEPGIVVPELASGPLRPGAVVEVIYPGGQTRGYIHLLQSWDGQRWTTPYQVSVSDPRRPPSAEHLGAHGWADGDEAWVQPDIGFGGADGGQYAVIPPPADPGTYRICHVSTAHCSEPFEVTRQG